MSCPVTGLYLAAYVELAANPDMILYMFVTSEEDSPLA